MAASYLQSAATIVRGNEGLRLARALSLRRSPALKIKELELERVDLKRCNEFLGPGPIAVTILEHLKTVQYRSDPKTALEHQRNALTSFKLFMEERMEENWMLPALEQMVIDMRLLAFRVDDDASRSGEKTDALESVLTIIREMFVLVSSDRSTMDVSKKWGMMFLINHLFSIAFRLNNFAIVDHMKRAMAREPQLMGLYHMSHRITYCYHSGRVALLNSQLDVAAKELSFAFNHCHKKSTGNKRLILIHLIPIHLLQGRLPSLALLEKYDLPQFAGLITAVRTGHVSAFHAALEEHQAFFVQYGIYLMLERASTLVFRRLVKRV
jgi:nuclear mRNA export protein PCID2/THP1